MYMSNDIIWSIQRSSKSECQITFHCFLQERRWLEKYYAYIIYGTLICSQWRRQLSFNRAIASTPEIWSSSRLTWHTERSSINHPLEYYVLGIDDFIPVPKTEMRTGILQFWHDPSIHELFARCSTKSGPGRFSDHLPASAWDSDSEDHTIPTAHSIVNQLDPNDKGIALLESNHTGLSAMLRTHYALDTLTGLTWTNIICGALFTKYAPGLSQFSIWIRRLSVHSICWKMPTIRFLILRLHRIFLPDPILHTDFSEEF